MATTPYPFVANAILTASQLNSTFNIPVSTKTASYTLVAADAGTRVVMNSASATTITVNTSLFSAGDNLQILNIGAGVCTVTAGTATVSTSGTLALVANAGGTLYFTSTGVSVFQATGVAASAGALVRVGGGTLSGASTTFSSVFSATYDSYLILVAGVYGSTSANINLKLGSTATGYYWARNLTLTGSTTSISGSANTSNFDDMGASGATLANSTALQFYLHNPFATQQELLAAAQ